MKDLLLLLLLSVTQSIGVFSQNIPLARITNWDSPGGATVFTFRKSVLLSSFGADTSGVIAADNALQSAINSLNGSGQIFVQKGTYLFNQTIQLPDSIIIQGELDSVSKELLVLFKLSPGNNRHGINISGTETNTNYTITYPLMKDKQKLFVSQPQLFMAGDHIRLKAFDDSLLVNDTWAYHSTGQIFKIIDIEGDSLLLDKPLRRSYNGNLPVIYKLSARRQVHIKCIKIQRVDITASQSSSIYFNTAADCSVSGIESRFCNFAHVDIVNSTRISIENSFFKDALSYGSGGKGYGIMLQSTSGDCYIHQNNFEHLRHAVILQSGANGNVIAYNYSRDPFWTETSLPANSSGDVVLHGNYPYMNLFESNVAQNIVIDNSHGINGPYNTFYRNRAELYGIFMNTSPASGSQNFIGNQVVNTSSPFLGFYTLAGTDHFEYGNMVKGNVRPVGTVEPIDSTLFGYTFGTFYDHLSTVPPVKNNNWLSSDPLIEAEYRYYTTNKAICNEVVYTPVTTTAECCQADQFSIYPNPFMNEITLESSIKENENIDITLTDLIGREIDLILVKQEKNKIIIATPHLPAGMYLLNYRSENKQNTLKLLKPVK